MFDAQKKIKFDPKTDVYGDKFNMAAKKICLRFESGIDVYPNYYFTFQYAISFYVTFQLDV